MEGRGRLKKAFWHWLAQRDEDGAYVILEDRRKGLVEKKKYNEEFYTKLIGINRNGETRQRRLPDLHCPRDPKTGQFTDEGTFTSDGYY
jgi:hypothetical protein